MYDSGDYGCHDDRTRDDRYVTLMHVVDDQSSYTRPGENGFGDDGTADSGAELTADDCQNGNEGISEGSLTPLALAVRR